MTSAIESAELAFNMSYNAHSFTDFRRPQNFDVGLLHSRMAFIFTELTFNYDLAIRSAVNGLRWFKVPLPKQITRGMVVNEMMLLHTGMSSLARDYSRMVSSPITAARAILRCWSCLAFGVSGSMLNALSSGALRECLGWDEENAKAYLHLHTANLAMVVPDSPEFVFAMSSVSVVGFLGFKRTASLAMKKAAEAFKKIPRKGHGDIGTFAEMTRVSAKSMFMMTKGCLMVSEGKVQEGIRLLSEGTDLATTHGLAVLEMISTNFSIGINSFILSEPKPALAKIEQLRMQANAASGFTSFAGRLWGELYGASYYDWNVVIWQIQALSESEQFPISRMFQLAAMSTDICAINAGEKPKGHGEGHCPEVRPGEKPRHQYFLEDLIPRFLQYIQSYKVNDYMPWSLTYSVVPNIALALLNLLFMRWHGEPPDDCALDKLVPAVKLIEKVLIKGAKIQRVVELSFCILLVLLGEALDPEGFASKAGVGRDRLARLERALKRADANNSAAYDFWMIINNFHVDRLRGKLTASSALSYQEQLEAFKNDTDVPIRLRACASLSLAYLPTEVSSLEKYIKVRASPTLIVDGGSRAIACGLL